MPVQASTGLLFHKIELKIFLGNMSGKYFCKFFETFWMWLECKREFTKVAFRGEGAKDFWYGAKEGDNARTRAVIEKGLRGKHFLYFREKIKNNNREE